MKALSFALAIVVLLSAPLRLGSQTPMREVLDSETLQALGIHRFSDLVAWVGWGSSSQDGISWSLNLDGQPGSLPSPSRWYVNGVPTDVSAFGSEFPELLPAIVQQVDSVVVHRGSSVVAGRRVAGGTVEIFTRRAPSGPAAAAWVRHGAETGDPGPFVYTPYRTRGVDQTGPDGSFAASWGGAGWRIDGGARYLRTDVSDANLRERYGEDYLAFTQARGGQIGASVDAVGGTHRLEWTRYNQIGHTSIAGQRGFDRVDLTREQVAASGDLTAGPGWLRYHASRRAVEESVVRVGEKTNTSEVDAAVGVGVPLEAGSATLAISTLQGGMAARRGGNQVGLLGRLIDQPLAGWSLSADAGAVRQASEWDFVGGLSAERSVADNATIELAVSRSREAGFGYAPPAEGTVAAIRSMTDRISAGIATAAGSPLHLFARFFVARTDIDLRLVSTSPWTPGDRWEQLGGEAGVRWSPGAAWTGSLQYTGLILESDGGAAASPLLPPAHQVRALSILRVAPTFQISTSAQLASSREVRSDLITPDEPVSSLASLRRIDLGIDKTFWSERLQTAFWLRNLLGQPEQLHPYGADFGFRYVVTARFTVP